MNEDYERRIRNLERMVMQLTLAQIGGIGVAERETLEMRQEEFFHSVSNEGISGVEFETPPNDRQQEIDG